MYLSLGNKLREGNFLHKKQHVQKLEGINVHCGFKERQVNTIPKKVIKLPPRL